MARPTVPTVGGSSGSWGDTLNAAIYDVSDRLDYLRDAMCLRFLGDYAGATDSDRFRAALADTANVHKTLIVPHNTTLDAGTSPFMIPTGFGLRSAFGDVNEGSSRGVIKLRHTGASGASAGVFRAATNARDWSMSHISFQGTASVRAFQSVSYAAGEAWAYNTLNNVSFNGFEKIYDGPHTGSTILGTTYWNNFSGEPWTPIGSDCTWFTDGLFYEMGGLVSASTRNNWFMMNMTGMSNCFIGPIYATGSPSTIVRVGVSGSSTGGIQFNGGIAEGRPSHGGTLWCAGSLMLIEDNSVTILAREHGYAMRSPSSVTAYTPRGFYTILGGEVTILGGTWTPYPAAEYPASTYSAAGALPPFAFVGSGAVLNITGVHRGPNATALPVVINQGGTVRHDGCVTVTNV